MGAAGTKQTLAENRDPGRLRTWLAALATLCGGLLLLILFLALFGVYKPTEAVGLTVAAIVFFVIWGIAFVSRHRRADEAHVQWRDRERRGF